MKKKKILKIYKMSASSSANVDLESSNKIVVPDANTCQQAVKLSIKIGKPMDFYFYIDSCKGNLNIVSSDNEKVLYKNSDEYTSPIQHTYKVGEQYLIVTENTIYVISCNTKLATLKKES